MVFRYFDELFLAKTWIFHYLYLPEGHFVWATLKNVRPSVRPAPATAATDFGDFCHCVEGRVTRFLGGTVKASAKS